MELRKTPIRYVDNHHTAGHEKNTQAVRQEHLNQGWGDIGYNSVIEKGGVVGKGRDVMYAGAHDPGVAQGETFSMNHTAYAIASIGMFHGDTPDVMSEVQFQALLNENYRVMKLYGIPIERVRRHKDQYATACPGDNFPWNRLITELTKLTEGASDVFDEAILKFSSEDDWAAKDIDAKRGGIAGFTRQGITKIIPPTALKCQRLIIVGGPDVPEHPNRLYLSGKTKFETAARVGLALERNEV